MSSLFKIAILLQIAALFALQRDGDNNDDTSHRMDIGTDDNLNDQQNANKQQAIPIPNDNVYHENNNMDEAMMQYQNEDDSPTDTTDNDYNEEGGIIKAEQDEHRREHENDEYDKMKQQKMEIEQETTTQGMDVCDTHYMELQKQMKLTQQNYSGCTQQLTKCNTDYKAQNQTVIQLTNSHNKLQNDMLLLQESHNKCTKEVDEIKNNLTDCNQKYDELSPKYTELNELSTNLKQKYDALQISADTEQEEIKELIIKNEELKTANDRYVYGKQDEQIKSLNHDKMELLNKVKDLEKEIKKLLKENGKYEQQHANDEENYNQCQQMVKRQETIINQKHEKIEELSKKNGKYLERDTNNQQKLKSLKKKDKQIDILIDDHSLHENTKLKHDKDRLNRSLIQSVTSLKESKLRISGIEHDLGECNVEHGSCEQTYNQCEAATKLLQHDIVAQKEKFYLCNNVTQECKKEKKTLKTELKEKKNELKNFTNILNTECFILNKNKWSNIWSCLFFLCIVSNIVFIFMWIQSIAENQELSDNNNDNNDLSDKYRKIMEQNDELKEKTEIQYIELVRERKEKDEVNKNMEGLTLKNKQLLFEKENLELNVKQYQEQLKVIKNAQQQQKNYGIKTKNGEDVNDDDDDDEEDDEDDEEGDDDDDDKVDNQDVNANQNNDSNGSWTNVDKTVSNQ